MTGSFTTNKCPTPGLAMVVVWIAAIKMAVHFHAGHNYGYFIDELYYLACGRHLAWGYVDQPPLIALAAAATRVLAGESLRAIRFLPACLLYTSPSPRDTR